LEAQCRTIFTFDAIYSLTQFVAKSPPSTFSPNTHRCLADYIRSWLLSGEGVRVCQGNFEWYLIAVIVISHHTSHQGMGIPGYLLGYEGAECPVDSILGKRHYAWHEILDRRFFEECVRRTM
jgi:hypothetical protein